MGAFHITVGLERYNRIASYFGVEPRLPFTDRDLIEFQAHLPPALRMRDGFTKWPLRKAMAPLLPADVAWRRQRSHLGWRFNRALLAQARLAGAVAAEPPTSPWLDAGKLAALWHAPAGDAPDALLVRLNHRLSNLTGGPRDQPARHQTMHTAIAWSHDLLNPEERALFRRLSVFAGGFSLEAAERAFGAMSASLGIGADEPARFLTRVRDRRAQRLGIDGATVESSIVERAEARAQKDFARSDRIRDSLAAQGVELLDGPEGTSWRLARRAHEV